MVVESALARRFNAIDATSRNFGGLAVLVLAGFALSGGLPLVAVAAVVAIGGLIAIAIPEAIAAGVTVAIPLVFHPVAIRNQHFSLLELALLCGIGGLAIRTAYTVLTSRTIEPVLALVRPWGISAVVVVLVLVSLFSLSTVADHRHLAESERSLRVVIVEPIFALLILRDLVRRGKLWFAVSAMLGMGCVVSALAFRDIVSGQSVVLADGVARAKGPYPHPNNLALYLDRVALLALGLAIVDRARRRWTVPAAGVLLFGMALTLSRGAALAGFVGLAIIIAIARPRHGWRWFGAAVIAAVSVFLVFAATRFTANGGAGAESSRALIWRSSINMVKDHPIFGVGLDQFLYQYGRRYVLPEGWPERYTSHPHNFVLDVWLSLGLAGLATFAGLIVVAARRARLALTAVGQRAVAIGAVAALAGGLAHGLVDNSFFLADIATLTWIMIALIEYREPA
jgi:putative inorganic carbon (HCO3(-)) transporter